MAQIDLGSYVAISRLVQKIKNLAVILTNERSRAGVFPNREDGLWENVFRMLFVWK